jgi:8-oxo-dGTP pyrophosphatase MutT (NUDIX family)
VSALTELLQTFVAGSAREEADRCAMLRLATELHDPLSREEGAAHFTASAFVVDGDCERTCLVDHPTLGRRLQPGGHIEQTDLSLEAAALREAKEETALELRLDPDAPRPYDLDVHEIPERPGEPRHWHLDVRYLLVGSGEPCAGSAWYPMSDAVVESGDESVGRLAAKARKLADAKREVADLRAGSPAEG